MSKNKQNYWSSQREKAAWKRKRKEEEEREQARLEARQAEIKKRLQEAEQKKLLPENMRVLEEISPKLCEHIHSNADVFDSVKHMFQKQEAFIRPAHEWKPQGKSYKSLVISLANHLFAKYKTPPFIWSAFEYGWPQLMDLAVYMGAGNSLYNFAKNKKDFVPVTRQMSHIFSQCTTEFNALEALRYAQFISFGGSKRLFEGFKSTTPCRNLTNEEDFISTVIQWYCNQSMLDPGQVGPIWDYIFHCRTQDEKYSMKGRTADSVIKKMEEWHAQLQKKKYQRENIQFKSSGFEGVTYDWSQENKVQIWRIFELLTSDALYDEGRRMGHCVGSYSYAVQNGRCSIWALTLEDNDGNWAMNTIEVDNLSKRLVQVRGRHNRQPTAKEQQVLSRWANEKGLIY